MLTPPVPNLSCKPRPVIRRRGSNHRHRLTHGHGPAVAFHAHHRVQPLAQVLGSCHGIVLACEASKPSPAKCIPTPDVTPAANPKQIVSLSILLVAIHMPNLHIAPRSAQ